MPQKPTYEELEKRVRELEQTELESKQIEEELTQIFSMSLDMICIADIETATFIKVNPAFSKTLGHSENAFLDKPFLAFVHPDDIDATQNVIREKLKSGAKVINFENRYRCKDGSYRWLSWVSHPNPEKGVTYAVARDITQWKQNQEEFKKSKALLDAAGRMARVGGWELDVDTLEVTWTEETYHIHEVPVGRQPSLRAAINFFHPDDRKRLKRAIEAALEHGEPYDMEIRFITAKGNLLWTRTQCEPKMTDGRVVSLKGTFQDITDRKKAQEALIQSEERFRQLFENMRSGVAVYEATDNGENFIFRNFNRAAEKIEQISRADLLGRRVTDVFPAVVAFGLFDIFQAVWQTGKPQRYPISLYKDGRIEGWRENYVYKLPSGEIVSIYDDVTEKMLSEMALKRERELFKTIINKIPVMLAQYDPNANMLFLNREFERLIGWKTEEVQDIDLMEAVYPDPEYRQEAYEYMQEARTDWKVFRVQSKSGDIIESEWSNIKLGDGNQIGIGIDITERRRFEKALKQSEERYRNLVENLNDVIYSVDSNGYITYVSPAIFPAFGYASDELIGTHFNQLVHKDDLPAIQTAFSDVLQNRLYPGEYRIRTRDGDYRWVRSSSRAFFDKGNAVGLQGVLTDITEIKELETKLRQIHKMEAIGTLAGGIAHEFNNVLGIIMGNAELAMDDIPEWNPAKESLKEIRKASFRARDVVQQILSFARKSMTSLKPLEINTIVKESLNLMRASIPAMIDIEAKIPSKPNMILSNPTEIHQIIINLCTNAAYAMKESGGTLEAGISEVTLDKRSASRYEDLSPGNFIKLTVKDSGTGMSPDILEKVFEPYFTTKEFGAGSGMGLAVVYGIVKKCKGAIRIESNVDEGTTVEVLFPKIEEEVPAKKKKEDELPTGSERILLVDDDPSIVSMICQMLERLGYKVTGMTDSVAVLRSFTSTPHGFDLVITDMAMPKMSGEKLADEMLRVRKDIPILLCTGHSDTIDEKKAKEIGIKGFAMKPLDMGKLARAVRLVLDGNHDT